MDINLEQTENEALQSALTQERAQMGRRLKWARERLNMSQKSLGDAVGVSQQGIQKAESGEIKKPEFLEKAAEVLGIPFNWLIGKAGFNEVLQAELTARVFIPEIGPDGAQIAPWSLPPHATGIPAVQNKNLEIRQVIGDSMAPDFSPGDFVLVNTGDISPSPAGLFMIHDGHGLGLRRIEPLPAGKLRVSAANPAYAVLEISQKDLTIYGRVVLKISKI